MKKKPMSRRGFLKRLVFGAGAASGVLLAPGLAEASEGKESECEFLGVLVDTTRCIGCRACEAACAQVNGFPVPDMTDRSVFEKPRKTSVTALTVVNRYETDKGEVFVKTQCMHCNQPGCVAPCLVKAMVKKKEGPVVWNLNCMGCRICMVSCPFDMPKFEYDSPTPKIQKCSLCWDRLKKGEKPACVEACPQEALVFGTRRDLLDEARKRIYQAPAGTYVRHIYGEHEVGGTGILYLSSVPFKKIGFRTDLGNKAFPELTLNFLYTIVVVDLILPAFLVGISVLTRRKKKNAKPLVPPPGSTVTPGPNPKPA
jgi:Fe-S-cluster-containing dehydrogenase component